MSKENIREMLDATINEDDAAAEAAFHAHATEAFRRIMEEEMEAKKLDNEDDFEDESDEDDDEFDKSDEDDDESHEDDDEDESHKDDDDEDDDEDDEDDESHEDDDDSDEDSDDDEPFDAKKVAESVIAETMNVSVSSRKALENNV